MPPRPCSIGIQIRTALQQAFVMCTPFYQENIKFELDLTSLARLQLPNCVSGVPDNSGVSKLGPTPQLLFHCCIDGKPK